MTKTYGSGARQRQVAEVISTVSATGVPVTIRTGSVHVADHMRSYGMQLVARHRLPLYVARHGTSVTVERTEAPEPGQGKRAQGRPPAVYRLYVDGEEVDVGTIPDLAERNGYTVGTLMTYTARSRSFGRTRLERIA